MATTLQGPGFDAAFGRMFKRAIALYGQDELASKAVSPARVTPASSAPYALEVALFWLGVAPKCVKRALEGADPDHPWLPITNAAEGTSWVHKALAEKVIAGLEEGRLSNEETIKAIASRSPLAAGILRDLEHMFTAIKIGYWGFGRVAMGGEAVGYPVMEAVADRGFWDAARRCAAGCAGSTASVTAEEKYAAFKEDLKENAREAAKKAGEAAGGILGMIGDWIGSGISGLFKGLGITNVAILGAGGFVAWRLL